ncbi:MAG: hypothetical protein SV377_08090 [Halobacteria archaeon]|nr:hypothetical protein [Halobacteria archaeon]
MPSESDDNNPELEAITDELRTISFRLREIQRLLSMRVTQENKRLEERGSDRVTEPRFFTGEEESED